MDAASNTTSFIRNATLSAIAGNPPADCAHPFGTKGMMVAVDTKAMTEPAAPNMPSFLVLA
jgi:hypothetical protein